MTLDLRRRLGDLLLQLSPLSTQQVNLRLDLRLVILQLTNLDLQRAALCRQLAGMLAIIIDLVLQSPDLGIKVSGLRRVAGAQHRGHTDYSEDNHQAQHRQANPLAFDTLFS